MLVLAYQLVITAACDVTFGCLLTAIWHSSGSISAITGPAIAAVPQQRGSDWQPRRAGPPVPQQP